MDQQGDTPTLADGKAGISWPTFFTTCPTICPKMTTQMTRVQEAFRDEPLVAILPPVTPETTRGHLAAYGELHGWTGPLASADRRPGTYLCPVRTSYFAALTRAMAVRTTSVHTENFRWCIRNTDPGYYDGTSTADVDRPIDDIRRLCGGARG